MLCVKLVALSRRYRHHKVSPKRVTSVRHCWSWGESTGVRTLRTQDTSDLPNFGLRTLRHVRSVPTFRHWYRSVFWTLRHYTYGVGQLSGYCIILVQQSHFTIIYFKSFCHKFAKYLYISCATVSIYFIYFFANWQTALSV